MPTVEKTGGGRTYVRGAGRFRPDDRRGVSEDLARHLVENRDDFEYVDESADGLPDDVPEGHCSAVKSDGELCGRELPCPYHSEED